MITRARIIATLLALFAGSVTLSAALALLNEPNDAAVVFGLLGIAGLIILFPWCLKLIWRSPKKGSESKHA